MGRHDKKNPATARGGAPKTNRSIVTQGTNYYGPLNPLKEDANKRTNLGIRFASNQRERIALALDLAKIYEPSPTRLHLGTTHEKLMNLRPRQEEKEIGPPSFRY